MLLLVLAMFLGLVSTAFGQRRGQYWSPGGYGNILYPGTGHAPVTPPGGGAWPNFFGGPVPAARPASRSTATPGETVILANPAYDDRGLDDQSGMYAPADGNQARTNTNFNDRPPVVIDQNFASPPNDLQFANQDPAVGREFGPPAYQNSAASSASAAQGASNRVDNDGKPTIYLIAFKDHSVVEALGYWTEGTMLHYVSVGYALNHASIALIDPDLSQRLNRERGIDFKLTGLK
jgi:hypothetical protein